MANLYIVASVIIHAAINVFRAPPPPHLQ